jgi:hypothetical protein
VEILEEKIQGNRHVKGNIPQGKKLKITRIASSI